MVWDRVTRAILKGGMDGAGIRPWEILDYTLPELSLMLGDDGERTHSGAFGMSDGEIADYVKWYHGMSNRERLEAAKRGEL